MEPLHATEGCRTETYIRQNFPDENTVLCSNMRGTLNLGFAKVLTVNDAIELLSRVKDKNKPLLTDMHHYCSNMSWEEDNECVKLISYELKGTAITWEQSAPGTVHTLGGKSLEPTTKVCINPHDGTMASFNVPGCRSDLVNCM